MSFISPYDPYNRYKRRSFERMKSTFKSIFLLGATFVSGFWIGGWYADQTIVALNKQIELAENQKVELENALTRAGADAQTAVLRYEQLETSVSEVISGGPMEELLVLLKKQLDQGVDPNRLLSVVRSAKPPQNCTDLETRRFVVATPTYKGPKSEVVLAEGRVRISGNGDSALNDEGNPEAWYDPSKEIAVEFLVDGQPRTKNGALPIYNSLIVGDKEYRVTVAKGSKSFAEVRYDSCDYP